MTIDEAITQLKYGIEQMTMELKSGLWKAGSDTELQVKQGIELNQQHIAWLMELKEAKRLLKLAIDDFQAIAEVHAAPTPILCPKYGDYMKAINIRTRKWQYEEEAEKLLNG